MHSWPIRKSASICILDLCISDLCILDLCILDLNILDLCTLDLCTLYQYSNFVTVYCVAEKELQQDSGVLSPLRQRYLEKNGEIIFTEGNQSTRSVPTIRPTDCACMSNQKRLRRGSAGNYDQAVECNTTPFYSPWGWVPDSLTINKRQWHGVSFSLTSYLVVLLTRNRVQAPHHTVLELTVMYVYYFIPLCDSPPLISAPTMAMSCT